MKQYISNLVWDRDNLVIFFCLFFFFFFFFFFLHQTMLYVLDFLLLIDQNMLWVPIRTGLICWVCILYLFQQYFICTEMMEGW